MPASPLESTNSSDDVQIIIAQISPFKDLPDAVLGAVAEVSEVRTYAVGETIYALGQYDGGELFIVSNGKMKATLADIDSGSMMIDVVEEGSIFGLAATVAGDQDFENDKLTLAAETDVTVVSIEAEAFRVIVAQRPSLTRNLMHHFARTLAGAQFNVASQESSPERRIYATLLEYVERDAINADWRIANMPKHRELAEKADVAEALVASAVAQLIQDEIARRDYPGLIIADMGQLNRLAS